MKAAAEGRSPVVLDSMPLDSGSLPVKDCGGCLCSSLPTLNNVMHRCPPQGFHPPRPSQPSEDPQMEDPLRTVLLVPSDRRFYIYIYIYIYIYSSVVIRFEIKIIRISALRKLLLMYIVYTLHLY